MPQTPDTALITVKGPAYTVAADFPPVEVTGILEMTQKATLAISSGALHVTSGTGTAGALAGTITVAPDAALELGADGSSSTFNNTGTIALQNSNSQPANLLIFGMVTFTGKDKINFGSGDESNQIVSDGNAATDNGRIPDCAAGRHDRRRDGLDRQKFKPYR